ncbi:MAG: VOC family protein [Gammaproteobacteria bacterium]
MNTQSLKLFKGSFGPLPLRAVYRSMLMVLLSGVWACSSPGIERIPPVTPVATHRQQVGKVVWHDLLTSDVSAAKRFYGALFNWTFKNEEDPNYTVILNYSRPIGGIVSVESFAEVGGSARWLASLSVKDVDQAAEFVRTSGGLIHEKPQDISGRGRLAIVSDPQDAQFVLLRSVSGDPPERPFAMNEWIWDELWTNEKKDAIAFYSLLAGYTHEVIRDEAGHDYDVLKSGIHLRAGVAPIVRKDVRPMWLSYIRVQDPAAMVERVAQLGGRVILAPSTDFEKGAVAIVADPGGSVFAMQKWTGKAGGS